MQSIIRSAVNSLASYGFIDFLKKNNFQINGTDVTTDGLGKVFCDNYYKIPFASEGLPVIEAYTKIIKERKAKWIISGPENEIILLAKHSSEFEKNGCQVFHSPEKTLNEITNKWELYKKTYLEMPNPFTIEIKSVLEDNKHLSEFDKKVVVKPKEGRGSKDVFIVAKENLLNFIKTNKISNEFICQEFLSGKEYSVDTLHDMKGNLLNGVVRERVQTDSGISVISKTLKNEKIFDYITKLSEIFEFRGATCVQFIENNNEFYLTDINPRFGGGSILSVTASKTFSKNVINLLNNNLKQLDYENCFEYDIKTMYRSYKEFYK